MIKSIKNTSNLATAEYKKQSSSSNLISKHSLSQVYPALRTNCGGIQALQFSEKLSKMLLNPSKLCCACGVKFNSDRALRYHFRGCSSMSCCGRRYNDVGLLRHHVALAHSSTLKSEEIVTSPSCKFCGKNFKSVVGRDSHVKRYCTKNPNSSRSLRSSDVKTDFPPPTPRPCRKTHHSAYAFKGFSYKNSDSSLPPISTPILPKLKLPHGADYSKWKLLNNKLKTLLDLRFPPSKRKTLDLDSLAFDSSVFIRQFLEEECGTKIMKKGLNKKSQKKFKFSRAYRRLRQRKNFLGHKLKRLEEVHLRTKIIFGF